MDRFVFARTAFVVLGVWFLLRLLEGLPTSIHLFRQEPIQITLYLVVLALGVLVILWSGSLARRTVRRGGLSEGTSGPIRLADMQATGIGLLGLGLIVWHSPGVLRSLYRFPSYWVSFRTSGHAEDFFYGEMTSSWWLREFFVGASSVVVGVVLVLAARSLARSWSRRLGDPALASTPEHEPAPARPRADSSHVQAAALAVLGLYVIAQALPGLILETLDFDFRSPFEWTLEGRPRHPHWPDFLRELLRVAAGLWLFFGARNLARFWQRLRSSSGVRSRASAGQGEG